MIAESSRTRRRWALTSTLLVFLGVLALAFILFLPDLSPAPSPYLAIALHSTLEANYQPDPRPQRVPPADVALVADVLRDNRVGEDEIATRMTAVVEALQTGVPTITPAPTNPDPTIQAMTPATPTPTNTPEISPTPTPFVVPSVTPTVPRSPVPTVTSAASPTPRPSATATRQPSATPTVPRSPTPGPSATPGPGATPEPSATPGGASTPTPQTTATASPLPTPTGTGQPTGTVTLTPAVTATRTPPPTATGLPTATRTPPPTATGLPTATSTPPPTATATVPPPPPTATFTPTPSATPPATTMHVGGLSGSGASTNSQKWAATVTVNVHDTYHAPLPGVTVSGAWSIGGQAASCVTDGGGNCAVSTGQLDKTTQPSITFDITGLSAGGFTYDGGANHASSVTITAPP